ncbi:hypothetical protein TcCL_ESM06369 [Trypanosoma cruzi]|uniref:Uncharacterized protein n=3 Tax=Trypanosoma cruzi TaxID=5693 RepID=Q4DQI3_TRYCC|nr:hypothetical protein, conserved [Trypanosoma cruzi]EAN94787.1 hypothetical protein, conserved [Trypanosoma cruzi]KAF5226688.1 hypothetical protein ECC02_000189 [Trypanosoma cruzi]RNC56117.1 hypothetical protein TcCL_ESM06369 [Trypanosoma cruzi]|eukprot:XP_816638.1 hypothetical protein [Trypanosoma cruzi strain CL Brener]
MRPRRPGVLGVFSCGISAFHAGRPPRAFRLDYTPLSTTHTVFGQKQATVPALPRHRRQLSTDHPAFGTNRAFSPGRPFKGPISVSGFFLAVDPNFAAGTQNRMNPNAQITVRDSEGNMSRVRYRCHLESYTGLKLEALIRLQVGWISPKVTFSFIPYVIYLGKGFDLSIPFFIHFTMVSVLDEHGDRTGSFLYFSGTPMLGFSAGLTQIRRGKLVLNPAKEVDPVEESKQFVGKIHVRQLGFVLLKCLGYALCFLACVPASQRFLQYMLPDPFHRHSESAV